MAPKRPAPKCPAPKRTRPFFSMETQKGPELHHHTPWQLFEIELGSAISIEVTWGVGCNPGQDMDDLRSRCHFNPGRSILLWFLTLLEVLNPTSSIHIFIEPFVVAKIKFVSWILFIFIAQNFLIAELLELTHRTTGVRSKRG